MSPRWNGVFWRCPKFCWVNNEASQESTSHVVSEQSRTCPCNLPEAEYQVYPDLDHSVHCTPLLINQQISQQYADDRLDNYLAYLSPPLYGACFLSGKNGWSQGWIEHCLTINSTSGWDIDKTCYLQEYNHSFIDNKARSFYLMKNVFKCYLVICSP